MKLLVKTAFLSLLVGCTGGTQQSEEQIRMALAEQLQNIEEMTNQGHPPEHANKLYLEYFSANPSVLPHGGELLTGKEEIAAFYTEVFSAGKLISNAYKEPVIGISDHYAVRVYEGTAEIQPSNRRRAISYTNIYTDVMVREEGQWKIQWHSWVPAD